MSIPVHSPRSISPAAETPSQSMEGIRFRTSAKPRRLSDILADLASGRQSDRLALFVERVDGQTEQFVINRSFAARGTPDYNKIVSSLRSLSAGDCQTIAAALEPLLTTTPPIHPLADFINTLKQQSSSFEN